jgi:hypothetical protein
MLKVSAFLCEQVRLLFLRGTRVFIEAVVMRTPTTRMSDMASILLHAQNAQRMAAARQQVSPRPTRVTSATRSALRLSSFALPLPLLPVMSSRSSLNLPCLNFVGVRVSLSHIFVVTADIWYGLSQAATIEDHLPLYVLCNDAELQVSDTN